MTRTRTTEFRSYSLISASVEKCRELGKLGDSTEFNITSFITGPLVGYFRGRLKVLLCEDADLCGPAEVEISSDKLTIVLHARRNIWISASEGSSEERYILAHEIGHIWLHRNDTFGFSESLDSEHKFIPTESIVEDQAHRFAEIFLLPEKFVAGFGRLDDLIDYCDTFCEMPHGAIVNRFEVVQDKNRYHFRPRYQPGLLCQRCGSERVFAILSYQKCDECNKITY